VKETFAIVPASGLAVWVSVILVAILIVLIALFGWIIYSARNTAVHVEPEGLRISGTLYGRRIPLASLRLGEARQLNLGRDTDHQLKWRTNGIGLPGYKAGWFRLKNGEKALAFITDPHRVVYIPTDDGYSLLLSAQEPARILQSLGDAERTR